MKNGERRMTKMARLVSAFIILHSTFVLAQEPRATTRDVAVVAGKVERLDPFARSVTLRTPEGLLHTVVPAAPSIWITALARFGTMSFVGRPVSRSPSLMALEE